MIERTFCLCACQNVFSVYSSMHDQTQFFIYLFLFRKYNTTTQKMATNPDINENI